MNFILISLSLISVWLSVSPPLFLSLAVCLSPHPQFPVCLSTLLCSCDRSSSVGQQLSVYKADTLERQSVEDFQRSPSILIPFFDADSSTLFLFSRVSFVDSVWGVCWGGEEEVLTVLVHGCILEVTKIQSFRLQPPGHTNSQFCGQ